MYIQYTTTYNVYVMQSSGVVCAVCMYFVHYVMRVDYHLPTYVFAVLCVYVCTVCTLMYCMVCVYPQYCMYCVHSTTCTLILYLLGVHSSTIILCTVSILNILRMYAVCVVVYMYCVYS